MYFAVPLLERRGLGRRGIVLPLLLTQLALLVVAFALLERAPVEASGCTDLMGTTGDMLYVVVLGSALVGGLAWASAVVATPANCLTWGGFAVLALVGPYVIVGRWFWLGTCGWN